MMNISRVFKNQIQLFFRLDFKHYFSKKKKKCLYTHESKLFSLIVNQTKEIFFPSNNQQLNIYYN